LLRQDASSTLNIGYLLNEMSRKKNNPGGFVYSTDPSFKLDNEEGYAAETLPPSNQKLKIRLDTKRRAGKVVTLIEGFIGTESDLAQLEKKLKSFCGTGGSVKNNEIIIQGDQRNKVFDWLIKNEYKLTKKI
jgi:translation initiation factor 1